MDRPLDFQDRVFVNFRDFDFATPGVHGYRWVDIRRFRRRSDTARHEDVLAELIGHVQFRDGYAGDGVDVNGTRHGPYWIGTITPAAYAPISPAAAADLLGTWAGQYGDVPSGLDAALNSHVFGPLRTATALYRLDDLGEKAFHDWGGIHVDFHELVLIDADAGTVTLLVAADD